MDIKKFAPWNWFKEEEKGQSTHMPVSTGIEHSRHATHWGELHGELDRMIERVWRSAGLAPTTALPGLAAGLADQVLLKPSVDIAATDEEYVITVEVPGVEEKDISLELLDDTLTIRGTKRQESSAEDEGRFRVERAYGQFQRVLSLPRDADQEKVNARFRNGVLTITMPRDAEARPQGKPIEIQSAA